MPKSATKDKIEGRLLNQLEAAEFLAVSVSWLQKRRGPLGIKDGPPYVLLGGFVRYRQADLDEYVQGLKTVTQSADENAEEE